MRRVHQGGDFLKEASEFAIPCDEMVVERFIAQEEVFVRTPHLHQKDLEQAFFCCNARSVCRQDRSAQARKPVQLYDSKEAHRKQQDDERGLCQDNTPENGQTHLPSSDQVLTVGQLRTVARILLKEVYPYNSTCSNTLSPG